MPDGSPSEKARKVEERGLSENCDADGLVPAAIGYVTAVWGVYHRGVLCFAGTRGGMDPGKERGRAETRTGSDMRIVTLTGVGVRHGV